MIDDTEKTRDAAAKEKEYLDFLDDTDGEGIYDSLIKDMIKKEEVRLVVNINDLRKKNPERCSQLLSNAFDEMGLFESAFRTKVLSMDPDYINRKENVFIGLEGSFGSRHVTPRTLSSRHIGQVICVEGIVTRLSMVRPKVVKSVHYCPVTKKFMERKYSDMTSYEGLPTSTVYPTKDDEGNLLETEYGLCVYKDHQTFTIQEMPEKSPPGQLPRSVDIIADNDLVDECKPGDRVQVVGSFRCLPSKQGSYTSGTFRCILLANNLQLLTKEVAPSISDEDLKKCKKFSSLHNRKRETFDVLARSLAPSIHGHEHVKKALLCMLLGGLEKILPNGTRLRGDINIMLIGDPSTAKSQLLRYVLHSAPRAIPTTGRGSSGVGLTAAVTSDPETGERRLEAGAMVLADRGVVCIDEFDKMSDIDRTAIHEVMEQGRVTITKAGINARLNARCSVLAAANPVYGRYDEYKSPMENIGMQDSLLSRFDLLFIVLDEHKVDSDRKIADHVVRMHQYRNPQEQEGEPLCDGGSSVDLLTTKNLVNEEDEENDTPIYEKHNNLLHGRRNEKEKIVSVKFIKKYIHVAKGIKPQITDEAKERIEEAYPRLRSFEQETEDMARTQPITVRALETMIRLATAHAKGRMSTKVELEDAEAAIELVQVAYFKRIIEKPKKPRRRINSDGEEYESDEDMDMDDDEEIIPKKKFRATKIDDEDEPMAEEDEAPEFTQMDNQKFRSFKSIMNNAMKKAPDQKLSQEPFVTSVLASTEPTFTLAEINWALQKMEEDNQILVTEGEIYLI